MKRTLAGIAAAALSLGLAATAQPADAATIKPVRYANCTALTKVYPHGVARAGGRDLVKGKVARTSKKGFVVDAKVYALNVRLDADRDGVACER